MQAAKRKANFLYMCYLFFTPGVKIKNVFIKMINTELSNEFILNEYLKNIYLNYFFTKSIFCFNSFLNYINLLKIKPDQNGQDSSL